jgi:beta-glucosidase
LFIWVISGRPLSLPGEAKLATALAWSTSAGTQTGPGLARLTYGLANFSGRLPMTFPLDVGQCPIYLEQENTGRPAPFDDTKLPPCDPASWPQNRAYLKWKNASLKPDGKGNGQGEVTPLYWAGHGLSYSNFEYGAPAVSTATPAGNETLKISVKVANGFNSVAGRAVTQLYLTDPEAKISRPALMLRGVHKTRELQPGESETAEFEIRPEDFAYITRAKTLLDFKQACESGKLILSTGPTPYQLQSVTVTWKKPKLGQ